MTNLHLVSSRFARFRSRGRPEIHGQRQGAFSSRLTSQCKHELPRAHDQATMVPHYMPECLGLAAEDRVRFGPSRCAAGKADRAERHHVSHYVSKQLRATARRQ